MKQSWLPEKALMLSPIDLSCLTSTAVQRALAQDVSFVGWNLRSPAILLGIPTWNDMKTEHT
jgi:hypothetical protein